MQRAEVDENGVVTKEGFYCDSFECCGCSCFNMPPCNHCCTHWKCVGDHIEDTEQEKDRE